jgi:hypothetical protein
MADVRVSHERAALEALASALGRIPNVQAYHGMGTANRLAIPGWDLAPIQRFQYGDLRLEGPHATVIIGVGVATEQKTALRRSVVRTLRPRPARSCRCGTRLDR